MNAPAPLTDAFWHRLFPENAGPETTAVPMRLLLKRGKPFLLLPHKNAAAATCLTLYSAQKPLARLTKTALAMALSFGWVPGAKRIWLQVGSHQPFARFLSEVAQTPGSIPPVGILAGNPAATGQRFLVLLTDRLGSPTHVVKAGYGPAAINLITSETLCLRSAGGKPQVPRLRGELQDPEVSAFALDFFPGTSPDPDQDPSAVLTSWINPNRRLLISDSAFFAEIKSRCSNDPLCQQVAAELENVEVRSVLAHNDFAPWNIRADRTGAWTVLDWERGTPDGLPGIDWFHYLLQPAILVQRQPLPALLRRIENLCSSPAFRKYAVETGIAGHEHPFLLLYLLYMTRVIRPSEGLRESEALLQALSQTTTLWA